MWAGTAPLGERFATATTTLRSLATIAGLLGYGAWSGNIVLGARIGLIERAWDGLDHLYRAHRRTGEATVLLLVLHGALMLASIDGLGYLDVRTGAIFLGPVVLGALVLLVLVSVYGRLHRDPFVLIQRALGGLFLVGLFHVFGVEGAAAGSRTFAVTLGLMAFVAACAWIYRSILGRRVAPRHHYTVAEMRPVSDRVTEVLLDPVDHPLEFSPGQFAFLSLGAPTHDTRPHPFSLTSRPDDPQLRFVVKGLGDHTRELACVAHAGETYFHDELAAHVDVIVVSEDRDGFLTAGAIAERSGPLAADTDYLLCGPPAMMRSLRGQLEAAGVPGDRIHAEDFTFRKGS